MKPILEFDLHLFDLDDTLINTRPAYHAAQEKAVRNVFPGLSNNNITENLSTLKWFCQLFGSGNVEAYFRAFLEIHPDLFNISDNIVASLLEEYHKEFQTQLRSFKGITDYLESLMAEKKVLALVSNGHHDSQTAKLKKAAIHSYFPEHLCFISGNFKPDQKKPSPYMIKSACQKTKILPQKTIFYGNVESDMVAGKLAKVSVVHFGGSTELPADLPPIAQPDMSFLDWRELHHQVFGPSTTKK